MTRNPVLEKLAKELRDGLADGSIVLDGVEDKAEEKDMHGFGQLLGFLCIILPTMLLGWVIGADNATKFAEWVIGWLPWNKDKNKSTNQEE